MSEYRKTDVNKHIGSSKNSAYKPVSATDPVRATDLRPQDHAHGAGGVTAVIEADDRQSRIGLPHGDLAAADKRHHDLQRFPITHQARDGQRCGHVIFIIFSSRMVPIPL